MLVSGYNYRSIFEQTGLSFDLNCSINNVTGSGAFGFSGEGNQVQFTFQSGRIYDFENRYVSSYQTNTSFSISGDIENTNYSYYVNKTPVCFNGVKSNFKVQNFFYNASNAILDTSLKINSIDPANFTLLFPSTFQVGKTFTGQIVNNSSNLAFKIFSGSLIPTNSFTLNSIDTTISGLKSGNIKLNTVNEVGGYFLTLNLYTNFGLIQNDLVLTGLFLLEDNVILSTNPDGILLSGVRNSLQNAYSSLNYSRGIYSGTTLLTGYGNLPLNIKFEYYTGTTGEFKDAIIGSGYGYNLSATDTILTTDFGFKDFNFTGLTAISGQNYKNVTYTGLFPATGIANVAATGIFDYSNIQYYSSGFFTGLAIGTFNLPYYVQYFTGGIDVTNLDPNTPGTGAISGFNTTWLSGTVSGTGFVFSGIVSGSNYLYLANRMSGLSTGYLSGDLFNRQRTGIVTFSPGSYSRIPRTVTGDFQIVNSGLPIQLGFSGTVYNRDNLYGYIENLTNEDLIYISASNIGFVTGFKESEIQRRGLVIFDSGNPNNFVNNPIIFDIQTGQINRIKTYPDVNLTFVLGNFDTINDATGRWNGFLLTGNNFTLTGWDPRVRQNAVANNAYLNDVFLTGDSVYIGGYFNEINLNVNYDTLGKIKTDNTNLNLNFGLQGSNVYITKFLNIDGKIYAFGNFNNLLKSNFTTQSLWANPRSPTASTIDGYYNNMFIFNASNDNAISDPYDAHLKDYIGVTGYNQINFLNGTAYDSLSITGKNYLVGNFQEVGLKRRVNIAAFDEKENLLPYSPEINSSALNFMFESGTSLFVGGNISSFGSVKYNNANDNYNSYALIKLNNPFTIDRNFASPSLVYGNNSIATTYDIDFSGGKNYVVGNFQYVIPKTGNQNNASTWIARSGCAVFDISGNLLNEYYNFAGINNPTTLKTIFITGSTGYFGGNFNRVYTSAGSLNSGTRYKFAAIDLNTQQLLPITGDFDPEDSNGFVNKINHYTGSHILVVGTYTTFYSGRGYDSSDNTINRFYTDGVSNDVNGLTFLDTKRPSVFQSIRPISDRTTSQSTNNSFEGFTKFITNNTTGLFLYGELSSSIDINDQNTSTIGISDYDNKIIQLNITGGLITGFTPSIDYGGVYSAFVTGNSVIIGGNFNNINGTGSARIANLTTGNGVLKLDSYTGLNLNSQVDNISFYNNDLISVGNFSTFSGNKNADKFLYHNISGNKIYHSLNFINSNAYITNLKQNDGNIYLLGRALQEAKITPFDSTKKFGIINLNNSISGFNIPNTDFNKNLIEIDTTIECFATGSSGIYLGGNFKYVNDSAKTGLCLIDYSGNILNWSPNIQGGNAEAKTLVISGNYIYIGGNYYTINDLSIPSLSRIRIDTNASSISDVDTNFLPNLPRDTNIYTLYPDNQYLYVGGDFDSIANSFIKAFAKINSSNAAIFNSLINIQSVPAAVYKIVKTGDLLLIGGEFTYDPNASSLITNFIAAKDDGTIANYPTGLFTDNDIDKYVNDINIGKNNRIYIAGNLGSNTNVYNILGGAVSLDYDSGNNILSRNNWTPSVENKYPSNIYQSKLTNAIFILDNFSYAGHLRPGICEINSSGRLNLDFNPRISINSNQYIKQASIYNNTGIAIVGSFSNINTSSSSYKNFAVINAQDNSASNLGLNFSSDTQSVYNTGANIYVGGKFGYLTGNNSHQYFSNFIGFSTGNPNQTTTSISFIGNINSQTGASYININSIANLNNKFLVGGNFARLNPYFNISGSGAFVSGIAYVDAILTGTGNLTLSNSSGIYNDYLNYSGVNYSSNYTFSYVTNQGTTVNSTLNRSINEVLTTSYFTTFTGVRNYFETGSGIISGIQTLIRDTGLWIATGKFTGYMSGNTSSNDFIYENGVITTGVLFGSGYSISNISGDPLLTNIPLTGTIQVSRTYAVSTYTGAVASGTYFASQGVYNLTGINVIGSRIITGNYTGISTGDVLQINYSGDIITPQIQFITSGNYQLVSGAFGLYDVNNPIVYATGIFTYTTGNILTTGYLTGIPQYTKSFSGSFNILTGIFDTGIGDTIYTGLVYNQNTLSYTGSGIFDTGSLFNFRFDYTNYTDYSPLIGKLTLSGINNTVYSTLITGV